MTKNLGPMISCPSCGEYISSACNPCPCCGNQNGRASKTKSKPFKSAHKLPLNSIQFTNDNKQNLGFVGAGLILFGIFCPLIELPIIGSATALDGKLRPVGALFGSIAIISFYLTYAQARFGVRLSGIAGSTLTATLTVYYYWKKKGITQAVQKENFGFLQEVAELGVAKISLGIGVPMLAVGSLLLIVGGLSRLEAAQKSNRIHKKFFTSLSIILSVLLLSTFFNFYKRSSAQPNPPKAAIQDIPNISKELEKIGKKAKKDFQQIGIENKIKSNLKTIYEYCHKYFRLHPGGICNTETNKLKRKLKLDDSEFDLLILRNGESDLLVKSRHRDWSKWMMMDARGKIFEEGKQEPATLPKRPETWENYLQKIDVKIIEIKEIGFGMGKAIEGEVKNLGQQTLNAIQIKIYFLDAGEKEIFEDEHLALKAIEEYSDENPLKPNHSKKFTYYTKDVPSNWVGNKIRVEKTGLAFLDE